MPITKKYSHEELLEALYFIWDIFDRALVNFFVIGDTADSVINTKDLTSDKITVGIRQTEWDSAAMHIADAFALPLVETDTMALYKFKEIPIEVWIYKDKPCIMSCNQKIYHSEYFKYPNPYEQFKEVFSWGK